jgi:phage baseplate assembly protein V
MTQVRSQSEVERTRNQMLRVGRVKDVDAEQVRASIYLDEVETGLLPVLQQRAGRDRDYWLPAKDEQVMVFCPDGEPGNGVIMGGYFSDNYPPPRRFNERAQVWRDSTVNQYNPDSKHQHIELSEDGTLFLTAPTIVLRADRIVRDPYQRAFTSTPVHPGQPPDREAPPPTNPSWELTEEGMRLYRGNVIADTGYMRTLNQDIVAIDVSLNEHTHICQDLLCVPRDGHQLGEPPVPEPPPGKDPEEEEDEQWYFDPGAGSDCWAHMCENNAGGSSGDKSCYCQVMGDDPNCGEDEFYIPEGLDCPPPESFDPPGDV